MRFPTLPGSQQLSMPAIMRSPEWQALNGTQRNDLVAKWEQHAKRNQNDPSQVAIYAANYFSMREHPEQVVQWSPSQIAGMRGQLGPYVDNLLQFREQMKQPAKLAEAKADLDDVHAALWDLKINPDKDKEKSSRFQQYVETAINAEQLRKGGGELSRAGKQAIIQQAKEKVSYWNPGFFNSSVDQQYPWLLKPEDMTVPEQDTGEVAKILQDNGVLAPTNGDRWQAWQALLTWRAKSRKPFVAPAVESMR
jgi:hypothetical protein